MIQPSWSLDPLFVPPAHQCRMLRLDPAAPPLSILSPGRVSQRSAFGGSWQWQADHNVRGGPLETAAGTARWGFGVQARTELAFPLCGFTSGFRARVGLDAVVGRGGCARALIHADGVDSPPLWKSDLLIGSGTVADSGLVRLAAGDAAPREIVLVADDAHADRPPGADPFDIRDAVDWVDPVIVLDTGALRNRHAVRLPAVISAWNGWSIDLAAGATVEVTSVLDPLPASGRAGWIATAAVTAGEMRLRRRFPAPRPTEHLVIAASSMGDQPAEVQLRADGRRWNLPIARHVAAAPAVPLVLPLTDRPAGPLDVELAVPPGGRLWWHALGVVGPIDVDWHVLPPEAVESSAGSKLTVRDDGSVLVSGPVPKADRYALRFKCPISDLRALRIDLLPEQGCSSRDGSSGVIQTTGFSATIDVDGVPHNLVVETAAADPATGNPMLAIAGQAGQAWLIHGHQPASAMFQLAARNPPVRAGDTVTLTLEFSRGECAARCFRILGSADADARLPVRLATYLVHEPRPATAKDGRRTLVALPPAPDRQE
jgi:hypothetical protein